MPEHALARLNLGERHRALLLSLLREHAQSAEVWAYGSRVNGNGHDASDLDLVLRDATDPLANHTGTDALREALAESNLPIRVEVVDWASIPPAFRSEIERSYVVLQRPNATQAASTASET